MLFRHFFVSYTDVLINPRVFFELFKDFKSFAELFFEYLTRQHSESDCESDCDSFILEDMDIDMPPLEGVLSMEELKIVYDVMSSEENITLPIVLSASSQNSDEACSAISLDSYHSLIEDLPDLIVSRSY